MNENHILREGTTTYTRIGWGSTYTYADEATGESFDTGETNMPDARRVVFARHQAARRTAREAGETVPTYTIESGPQRARTGHQRHRYRNGEPVLPDAQSA